MKRALIILLVFIFTVSLSCCSPSKNSVSPITSDISFTAQIRQGDSEYEAFTVINSQKQIKTEIIKPENLKGMQLIFCDDEITIEYCELTYKVSKSQLPSDFAFQFMTEIFSNKTENQPEVILRDDRYFAVYKADNSVYILFMGATGLPIKVTNSESDLEVVFENVTIESK